MSVLSLVIGVVSAATRPKVAAWARTLVLNWSCQTRKSLSVRGMKSDFGISSLVLVGYTVVWLVFAGRSRAPTDAPLGPTSGSLAPTGLAWVPTGNRWRPTRQSFAPTGSRWAATEGSKGPTEEWCAPPGGASAPTRESRAHSTRS